MSGAAPVDAALADLRVRYTNVIWAESAPGRGAQLNAGAARAARAVGEWLWFVRLRAGLAGLAGASARASRRAARPVALMEDVEFVRRLTRRGRLRHLTLRLTTSARRWERGGWLRRSASNLTTLGLYALACRPSGWQGDIMRSKEPTQC